MQFVIPLSRRGEPLFRQVYRGLRQAILAGTFRAGERLPSTRELADELGISRTVVLLAYEQLVAEGFAAGRAGSGTYVSAGLSGGGGGGIGKAKKLERFARLRQLRLLWIFRGGGRFRCATTSRMADAATWTIFHFRCGGGFCCGMRGRRRFASWITARRRGASRCARRFRCICGGRAR
jgi:hypothetical protein